MSQYIIKHSRYLKGGFDREGVFVIADPDALAEPMYVQASAEAPVTIEVPAGHKVDEQMIPTDDAGLKEKKNWREKHSKALNEAAKNPMTGAAPTATPKAADEIFKGEKPKAHFADKAPHPMSSAAVKAQEQEKEFPPKHGTLVQQKHGTGKGGRSSDDEPI